MRYRTDICHTTGLSDKFFFYALKRAKVGIQTLTFDSSY